MIGQSNILKKYIDNFPSPTILIGPKGYGKKTLVNTIASMKYLDIIHISKPISNELKTKLFTYTNKAIICIDLTTSAYIKQIMSIQNSVLKLIEDLPSNFKLFILVEDESYLLDTILNRCFIQFLDDYTEKELRLIAKEYNSDNINKYSEKEIQYINSPRDILLNVPVNTINEIENLIDTIFSSIHRANVSNTLSISKKINFEIGESKQYDIDIFLNIFNYKLVEMLKMDYRNDYFLVFKLFNELKRDMAKTAINKHRLFEEFLLNIKYIL